MIDARFRHPRSRKCSAVAFCHAISISISQVSSRLQTLSDFPLNHVPVLEKKAINRVYTTLAHPVGSAC